MVKTQSNFVTKAIPQPSRPLESSDEIRPSPTKSDARHEAATVIA